MTKTSRLQQWYDEVWNNANEHFTDNPMHPQAIIYGLGTDTEKFGQEAFKPFYKSFREGTRFNLWVLPSQDLKMGN